MSAVNVYGSVDRGGIGLNAVSASGTNTDQDEDESQNDNFESDEDEEVDQSKAKFGELAEERVSPFFFSFVGTLTLNKVLTIFFFSGHIAGSTG